MNSRGWTASRRGDTPTKRQVSKRQVSKMYNITSKLQRIRLQKDYEDILVGLGGHYPMKEQQNYEEILVRSNAYRPH